MRQLAYRALQKLAVFEVARTLTADTAILATGEQRSEVVRLDKQTLQGFLDQNQAPGCEPFLERLDEPNLHAFGAILHGRLVSFAWLHEGSAEAGMNYGYHPGTATAIRLTDDAAFVFHLYTAPEARGQGWMRSVIWKAAKELLQNRSIRSFVTTTETINQPARRALENAGFIDRGAYCRLGVGEWCSGWYPRTSEPIVGFGGV